MPSNRMLYKRYNPCNRKLWNRFKKETGSNIDFYDFQNIFWQTNEQMAKGIIEYESAIKLPLRFGHVVVTKYKSSKTPTDWTHTVRLGKKVPLLNLHSFGYLYHIKWFYIGCGSANIPLYKFKACRAVTRAVAKEVKKGRKYDKWENTDFWAQTKTERMWQKFYNKQDDND